MRTPPVNNFCMHSFQARITFETILNAPQPPGKNGWPIFRGGMELAEFKKVDHFNGQIGYLVGVVGAERDHFLPITLAKVMFPEVSCKRIVKKRQELVCWLR